MTAIHYHSDCAFFAGCENMLANFLQDERLRSAYGVTFTWRRSPEYEEGLRRRVRRPFEGRGLPLVDFYCVSTLLDSRLYKAALRLLLVKYWLTLWNTLVLYVELGRRPVDLLHVNNGGHPGALSCMAAAFAARLRGVRTVYVVNNVARPYGDGDRWLDYPLDRLLARSVSLFVTGSARARRSLIEVLRLDPSRAVCLPNGIAPREVTETREQTLARLVVDPSRVVLAVVAVLEERKGHAVLLRALARLKTRPLTVIEGRGPLLESLRAQVRELGLEADVRFVEEKAVFNLLNAADVVALPSIGYEDFPNVTLEAMSLGKAVAASRLGGLSEQLEDGRTGLLVEPGDVDAWAAALERLTADAGLRRRLGEAAAGAFAARFTAERAVGNYLDLYRKLLNGRHP